MAAPRSTWRGWIPHHSLQKPPTLPTLCSQISSLQIFQTATLRGLSCLFCRTCLQQPPETDREPMAWPDFPPTHCGLSCREEGVDLRETDVQADMLFTLRQALSPEAHPRES